MSTNEAYRASLTEKPTQNHGTMRQDPTMNLPSAKALLVLATEAEKAKNEAASINDAQGFAIEHARQYALEALAWVAYTRADAAKARKEANKGFALAKMAYDQHHRGLS